MHPASGRNMAGKEALEARGHIQEQLCLRLIAKAQMLVLFMKL